MTAAHDRAMGSSFGWPGADLYLLHRFAPGRTPADAVTDIALAHALLQRAEAPDARPVLRLYRPARTVAFGRVDALRPGFDAAVAAAVAHGFAPVLRGPGGRAAAYHEVSLILDIVGPDPGPRARIAARFEDAVAIVVEALRALGIDARAGQLPGEYCPGAHSVLATGAPTAGDLDRTVKLGGAAQRNLRRAWHLSLSLVLADPDPVRRVLVDVYRDLGYPLDPSTVGAASDVALGVTVEDVERALLAAWAERFTLVATIADEGLLAEAAALGAIIDLPARYISPPGPRRPRRQPEGWVQPRRRSVS